jgi:predicted dehydrogenase
MRRRDLLALAGGAWTVASGAPSDRVRVAIVGLRGRGRDLMKSFAELRPENVEVAGLCDVDEDTLKTRAAEFKEATALSPKTVRDFRRFLDDKDIDAIAFATPNHWHALGTIWACQAGKDVYVEKPGSHTFWEGRKIIEAASKYKRIVQHGTQNRSSPNIVEAIQQLHAGVIGRPYMARGVAYKYRGPVAKLPKAGPGEAQPKEFDFDLWLGPSAKVPYSAERRKLSSGNGWHLLWEYGNGEIGNQGVHELDIMRWGLKLDAHPSKTVSFGGSIVHVDDQPTPQVQGIMYQYAGRDVHLSFETRGGFTNDEAGMGTTYPFLDKQNVVGVIFIGTEGYMIIPDYTSYHTFLGKSRKPGPKALGDGTIINTPHMRNFVQAVRSRREADLASGPQDLHYSCSMAHLANIAQRTGRMVEFDSKTEQIVNDAEANRMLRGTYREGFSIPEVV